LAATCFPIEHEPSSLDGGAPPSVLVFVFVLVVELVVVLVLVVVAVPTTHTLF
jgi:hypothetical protein